MRSHEPARLIDTCWWGRSSRPAPASVSPPWYRCWTLNWRHFASLLKSESRHFTDYLKLAEELGSARDVGQRLPVLLQRERELIESPDTEFPSTADPGGGVNHTLPWRSAIAARITIHENTLYKYCNLLIYIKIH